MGMLLNMGLLREIELAIRIILTSFWFSSGQAHGWGADLKKNIFAVRPWIPSQEVRIVKLVIPNKSSMKSHIDRSRIANCLGSDFVVG